ncbi:MAG: pilus assembly protein TadG-related protein [Actinomycetota bacterium]
MRMMLKRADDERGATIVIVALLLVVIFGMVVLVVDVGGLVTLRAEMIRASDSGALAAAQSCGTGESGNAPTNADEFAISNEPSIADLPNPVVYEYGPEGCSIGGGTVTVEYQAPIEFVFAPILGFDGSRPVSAEATAVWKPAGRANPVPFVANSEAFGTTSCEIDLNDLENVPEGTSCNLLFDNDLFQGSVFGSLNLNKWGVDANLDCSNKDLDDNRHYASVGGYDGPLETLELNFPNPTYVCAGDGLSDSLYQDLENQIGNKLTFPITQPPFIMQANKIDKFNVVGFAVLQLDAVLDAHEAGGQGLTNCRVDHDFGANDVINLETLGDGACFTGADPGLQIESAPVLNGNNPPCCVEGQHYAYDSTTHEITFGPEAHSDVGVEFDFSIEGECGTPPPNASARCIVTSWVGGKIGPSGGDGTFGGLNQIRLCEEDFGSCDLPE